jgi:uroporphyrinogen-III decarboxylase
VGTSTSERDAVKRLLDKVRIMASDPKNREKARYWAPSSDRALDHWRGTPRPRADLPRAPISVEPEVTLWRKILDFDIREYYQRPVTYLINYLRMLVYRFEKWDDQTVIDLNIPIWLGVTLESTLFGAQTVYTDDDYPWLSREPVITKREDLDKLALPDFRTSGLMPLAHRYYEEIRELVGDDFSVAFHEWGRSPFGVAFHIRGMENLLEDMLDEPAFTHRLMRFITEARRNWSRERAKFLGRPVEKGNLYNDEVNTPTISPALYEEFVLPYEQELSAFHGGILYWHSCGDTTALAPLIARIPNLEMFHVGPWTDGAACRRAFGQHVPLEFCLHPVKDVQTASRDDMERRLRGIAAACDGSPYSVRADGIQLMQGLEKDVGVIQDWIEVADRVLREG